jgi:hypothetical protein
MTIIEIRRVELEDLEQFNRLLNSICQEKLFLGSVDGVSMDEHRRFLTNIVENALPQVVAVSGSEVVGWCDVIPGSITGFTHGKRR